MYETISYEKSGSIATVSLNRSRRLNAFTLKTHPNCSAMSSRLRRGAKGSVARSCCGKGKGFCAEANLAATIESDDGEDPDLDAYPRETYGCLVAPPGMVVAHGVRVSGARV